MNTPGSFQYIGTELDLFSNACNWKRYLLRMLRPFIQGNVLEVGAGIGATASALCTDSLISWDCLEPDRKQVDQIRERFENAPLPVPGRVIQGTLSNLELNGLYDTIIYIDVLEHIQDDTSELMLAATHLSPDGRIVALCPAFQFLFSPFDESVGHFRRYTSSSFMKLGEAAGLKTETAFYLDSVGFFASLTNRYFLRSKMPTQRQINFWDKKLVPMSRVLDPFLKKAIGKSVVAVFKF